MGDAVVHVGCWVQRGRSWRSPRRRFETARRAGAVGAAASRLGSDPKSCPLTLARAFCWRRSTLSSPQSRNSAFARGYAAMLIFGRLFQKGIQRDAFDILQEELL